MSKTYCYQCKYFRFNGGYECTETNLSFVKPNDYCSRGKKRKEFKKKKIKNEGENNG